MERKKIEQKKKSVEQLYNKKIDEKKRLSSTIHETTKRIQNLQKEHDKNHHIIEELKRKKKLPLDEGQKAQIKRRIELFQKDNVNVLHDIEEEQNYKRDLLRQDKELESACEELGEDLSDFKRLLFKLDEKDFYKNNPHGQQVVEEASKWWNWSD